MKLRIILPLLLLVLATGLIKDLVLLPIGQPGPSSLSLLKGEARRPGFGPSQGLDKAEMATWRAREFRSNLLSLLAQALLFSLLGYFLLEKEVARPARLISLGVQAVARKEPVILAHPQPKNELGQASQALAGLAKTLEKERSQWDVIHRGLKERLEETSERLQQRIHDQDDTRQGMVAMMADLNDLNRELRRYQQELETTNSKLLRQRALLKRQQQLLSSYSELVMAFNSIDLDSVAEEGLKRLLAVTGAPAGLFYLWVQEEGRLDFVTGYNLGEKISPGDKSVNQEDLASRVARLRRPIRIKELSAETRFLWPTGLATIAPREVAAFPIFFHEELAGVVVLALAAGLSQEGQAFLNAALPQMGIAISNAQTLKRIQKQSLELSQANKKLREAGRLKSHYLATVSHELRTPINSIIGFTELLLGREGQGLSGDQKSYLERVQQNSRSLLKLIDDLLNLSQIEAGGLKVRLRPEDINELVASVARAIESQSKEKGVALYYHLAEDLPPVVTDRERVSQILNNLLSNAIKFTPAGGKVEIFLRAEYPSLTITVIDTGIGIDPQDQEEIFVEFGRAGRAPSRGARLGLAISRKLARLLGGEIVLKSQPGQGASFTLLLPLNIVSPTLADEASPGQG